MSKTFQNKLVRFLLESDGPTAVEYAVMLGLIVAVYVVCLGSLGTHPRGVFENTVTQIEVQVNR